MTSQTPALATRAGDAGRKIVPDINNNGTSPAWKTFTGYEDILHLSRMRRNVNRKVYNHRENVNATASAFFRSYNLTG